MLPAPCDKFLRYNLILDQGIDEVLVDGCGDEEAASEGAHLALWSYDALKAKKDTLKDLKVRPLSQEGISFWSNGLKKAEGQNLARTLMETPANYMTPTLFAQVSFISIANHKVPLARKRTQFEFEAFHTVNFCSEMG